MELFCLQLSSVSFFACSPVRLGAQTQILPLYANKLMNRVSEEAPVVMKKLLKILVSKAAQFQRKTKGQQLKGKIVSEFFTLFHNFWHFFIIFPPGLSPSKQRVLAQGERKRRKDNKKKRANRCCTLVVARLSSSYVSNNAASS